MMAVVTAFVRIIYNELVFFHFTCGHILDKVLVLSFVLEGYFIDFICSDFFDIQIFCLPWVDAGNFTAFVSGYTERIISVPADFNDFGLLSDIFRFSLLKKFSGLPVKTIEEISVLSVKAYFKRGIVI